MAEERKAEGDGYELDHPSRKGDLSNPNDQDYEANSQAWRELGTPPAEGEAGTDVGEAPARVPAESEAGNQEGRRMDEATAGDSEQQTSDKDAVPASKRDPEEAPLHSEPLGESAVLKALIFAAVSAALLAAFSFWVLPATLRGLAGGDPQQKVDAIRGFAALSFMGYIAVFCLAVVFLVHPHMLSSRWRTVVMLATIAAVMLVLPIAHAIFDRPVWLTVTSIALLIGAFWLFWHTMFRFRLDWLRKWTGGRIS